jgi:hypothetical protein
MAHHYFEQDFLQQVGKCSQSKDLEDHSAEVNTVVVFEHKREAPATFYTLVQ